MGNPNKRKPHESLKAYRARRKAENRWLKFRLRGRKILWPASNGTYIRAVSGELS